MSGMWILDRLEAWQEKTKIALRYGRETLTFKELWAQSEALAAFLEARYQEALRHKTPLVLYGAKELALVPAMHAALKCGVPYVPVDTRLRDASRAGLTPSQFDGNSRGVIAYRALLKHLLAAQPATQVA